MRKRGPWAFAAAGLTLLFGVGIGIAADPIQTQMTMSGEAEVDVMRASVKDDVLTLVLVVRNTSGEQIDAYISVGKVYYLDEGKKKAHVLRDDRSAVIAEPHTVRWIDAGGKQMAWMKLPAPTGDKIELVVPTVLPFEDLPISR